MPDLRSAIRLLRSLLYREDWNIGVIAQPAEAIVADGFCEPIRWLPQPPPRTMFADPSALIEPDGSLTLFAEFLDYRRDIGELWSAAIAMGDDPAEAVLRPLLTMPTHMSYPFPFRDDAGRVCLTAETWQAENALLWVRNGGNWQADGVLFPGRPVVDPTLWRGSDRWWLFCGFADDAPNDRLHLFHTPALGQSWTAHPDNPVKQDRRSSRGAGPIFRSGTGLIRPAQDCSSTYGGAVTLNVIRELSPDRFVEDEVRQLRPSPGRYPHGLHTIWPAGKLTFVDGKRLQLDPAGVLPRFRAVRRQRALRAGQLQQPTT
jgi:hypothetical protein